MYTKRTKFWHPYLINTIEMRSLWMEIKYIKSTARLLDRDWVDKRGLDLFKEVLWVSFGQRGAELPAVKVGGLKKNLKWHLTHSTSLERSKPFLLTQTLFKSLAVLLMYFIPIQKDLISLSVHHLPRFSLKQLCALAHLGCNYAAGTS